MKSRLHFLRFSFVSVTALALSSFVSIRSQDYLITFAASGESQSVSSVKVENLTQATSLIINGNDILNLKALATSATEMPDLSAKGIVVYPNPSAGLARINFELPVSAVTEISIFDISGSMKTHLSEYLSQGLHIFRISGLGAGVWNLSVRSGNYFSASRIVSVASSGESLKLLHESIFSLPERKGESKGGSNVTVMQYATGDLLKFTGNSGVFKTIVTDVPGTSKTIVFTFVLCTDGDNNNYSVVNSGSYTFMGENLKTTKYNDGNAVEVLPAANNSIPEGAKGYCWYNDDAAANKDIYGALYTWHAATDPKLCPPGWHLPDDAEWFGFTGFDYESDYGNFIGQFLKETGTAHWNPPNSGATDEKGFTGLPGGIRSPVGNYSKLGQMGGWWTNHADIIGWAYEIYYDNTRIGRIGGSKSYCRSVRCVKN